MTPRAVLFLLGLVPACVGSSREQATYVAVLGADTIVVERVDRTADSLTGEIAVRAPGARAVQRIRYAASLAPQGLVRELIVLMPADTEGTRRMTWTRMGSDSAGAYAALMEGSDPATARRFTTGRDAVPSISVSLGLLEQVLRRARNIPGDSVSVPVFLVDHERTMTSTARFHGDSVHLVSESDDLRLHTDRAGRILGGGAAARQLRIMRVHDPGH